MQTAILKELSLANLTKVSTESGLKKSESSLIRAHLLVADMNRRSIDAFNGGLDGMLVNEQPLEQEKGKV